MKLTPEEQAAADALALKNKQEDKNAKDKKESEDGDEGDEDGEDDPPTEDVATLKAQNEKLKKENAKRRVSERDTKAQIERQNQALAILQGKKVGDIDPIEKAQTESKLKTSRALIKAEIGNMARDAHNPGAIFATYGGRFKDIEVDLDEETVDTDSLKEVIDGIRKESPWMFQSTKDETKVDLKTGKRAPDKGSPVTGKNQKAEWQKLLQEGRVAEANKFYKENQALIRAQL